MPFELVRGPVPGLPPRDRPAAPYGPGLDHHVRLNPAAPGAPAHRPAAPRERPGRAGVAKTRWGTTAVTATFLEAVRENEEVVPVDTVSTWVLPSGVTVGR
ncbi:hypothetical protein GCM10009548_86890 [Streptomyces malaysiensis subsp. malaysiensis]